MFVEASIGSPSATIGSVALGTTLAGSFVLNLHLGPRASGPSEVRVQKFAIANAARTAVIVDPLEVSSATTFPVTVEPDGDVAVAFEFSTGKTTLAAETFDALCGAGGLRITGAIEDSLQDGATPVESEPFVPSGCP